MNEVETFLLKKFNDGVSSIESSHHLGSSDCLSKELIQLKDWINQYKEKIDPITLKEKLYLLNNVIAEWQMLLNKHNPCAPQTLRIVNNACGISLKKIKSELEAACEAGGGKQSIKSGWGISPLLDTTKIYGFEDELMVLEKLIVDKERKVGFKAIGIVGVTGVGKTTFCKVAFNNQEVRKYFATRIWVHLPKRPLNIEDRDYKKEMVKSILMCLGYEDNLIDQIGGNESDGLRKLLLALRLILKGKKYLIVLDGVWNSGKQLKDFCSSLTKEDNDQDQLAYGLPKGDGGTVIVTSRSKKLTADMVGDYKNLHRLVPLADDICWEIFLATVGKDNKVVNIEDMTKLKDKIVKTCSGLPLVAKMLGQIALQGGQNNFS